MAENTPTRRLRLLWLNAFVLFIAVWLFPVSNRMTRSAGLVLLLLVWFGFIGLCWRHRMARIGLLGLTLFLGSLLALPGHRPPAPDTLRSDYVAGLRRYNGVTYYWGGESPIGIDCSGLIRRGLIDSLFFRGIRTLNPALIRRAFSLWWHDNSAAALGDGTAGITVPVLSTRSVNQLDHTKLLPGDLAVTRSGVHVMAYLGDRHWIEADPEARKVITVSAPSEETVWLDTPMNIVRWSFLCL